MAVDLDFLNNPVSSNEQMQNNYNRYKDKFTDSMADLVNAETFMNLLVAEMTNQDPMEPTTNTEFVSQLATFSQMQYQRDTSDYAKATYAASLVGKVATASRYEGNNLISKTGVVESVLKTKDSYTVKIDGESFDIKKISSVQTAPEKVDETKPDGAENTVVNAANALGDSIARASMMVGMYATVSGTGADGKPYVDQGFITAISVKDGIISAVINDKTRPLSDITEVTYATVSDEEAPAVDPTAGVDADDEDAENAIQENAAQTAGTEAASTKSPYDMRPDRPDVVPDPYFGDVFYHNPDEIDTEQTAAQLGVIIPEKSEETAQDLVDEDEEARIAAVEGIEG